MDTSEKFILKCKKAKEIQELWKFERGDYFSTIEQTRLQLPPCIVDDFWISDQKVRNKRPDYWIWIIRQDQFQDMVMPEFEIFGCDAIEHFMDVFYEFQKDNNPLFNSMEELILSFVMHRKYQKKWNEKIQDWLKE